MVSFTTDVLHDLTEDPESVNGDRDIKFRGSKGKRLSQPANSIVRKLPLNLLAQILEYVSQYDLARLLVVCCSFNQLATQRLYKRVTVILNAEFPLRYKKNAFLFIKENGMRHMDSSLIHSIDRLLKFIEALHKNPDLVQKVKFFVFDKCHPEAIGKSERELDAIQTNLIEFFGSNSHEMNFLHITFVNFVKGIGKLTAFLQNPNIRKKIFKLFVTSYKDLYLPEMPQRMSNLFLILDDKEMMEFETLDLLKGPTEMLNNLYTLTCSTKCQLGLLVLKKLTLYNGDDDAGKLKLRGLTAFHCHKENVFSDENELWSTFNGQVDEELRSYLESIDKRLLFKALSDKVDLTYLTHLYLKVDCIGHRYSRCDCFPNFFKDLTLYLSKHGGLPKLVSFELELYPNLEWLRPNQILENILTPLACFIKSLLSLARLTIDCSTPGFKMFDNSMGMSSLLLNKLNERLMEAFFFCFLGSLRPRLSRNLKTLQLPDFFTSFIYYKPSFYESLLHTCDCWGCALVLEKLSDLFFPIDEEDSIHGMEHEGNFYLLVGFILGKLQADREVCIPIKQRSYSYKDYPIYKGQPHTLHNHFHAKKKACNCSIENDPNGTHAFNIDNLVTTYIIHQLRPIVNYITTIFTNLDNLMIHGIYYQANKDSGTLSPIFDSEKYPAELLLLRKQEMADGTKPDLPFGHFRDL